MREKQREFSRFDLFAMIFFIAFVVVSVAICTGVVPEEFIKALAK